MRKEFAKEIAKLYDDNPGFVFITGDLGFMALEEVRDKYRERFINAGVAEQNMVSLAAGLAHEGYVPWLYSISPFLVLRPYEQIRNDVCFHDLPVKLVGNGGGYGYGIMGATHHTLEDIAVMRVLPNMKVYVPLTRSDVAEAVRLMAQDPAPNYLRLNRYAENDVKIGEFKQWRRINEGKKGILISVGPVVNNVLSLADKSLLDDLEIWIVGVLPINNVPAELVRSLQEKKKLVTIEEHYGQCGLNEAIAGRLLGRLNCPIEFMSLHAQGYPSGKYGSQQWHQRENGLAGEGLERTLKGLLNG